MSSNNWKDVTTGDCKICGIGATRMRSWTFADFKNPLREFLDWLIVGLGRDRSGRTYAISHYGGYFQFFTFPIDII